MTLPAALTTPTGRRYVLAGEFSQPAAALWMHLNDPEAPADMQKERTRYPTPAVWVMQDDAVVITEQWQYFLRAINPGMTLQYVSAILGSRRAFTNRKGFNDPELAPRANYILRKDLDREPPEFDRVRTCGRALLSGVVQGEYLRVAMMDGSKPPPLKPGKIYPARVEDAKLDDYAYTPQTHPHLFFAANIITAEGRLVPFPNGAVYEWFPYGPVTWLPHVAKREVLYPLRALVKVDAWAGPYV